MHQQEAMVQTNTWGGRNARGVKNVIPRVLVILVGVVGDFRANETPLPEMRRTPAERKEAARKEVEAHYKSLPLDKQPVFYVGVSGKLVPAQIDPNENVECRWRGVTLEPWQIPGFEWSGSFGIMPLNPTGLEVRHIDPPIRYYAIAGTKRYGVGYYDTTNSVLYQWKQVELKRAALPVDAEERGLIVDASSVQISPVEPPPEFAPKAGVTVEQRASPLAPVSTAGRSASAEPKGPAAQTPAVAFEREAPVWPWLVGAAALFAIVAVAAKRRA